MLILDISQACNDPALATILSLCRKIFNLISLIAPIVLIVMLAVNFIKLMINPDDKKGLPNLKNSIFSCVIIFLIPTLVNMTLYLLGESTSFSACWNSEPNGHDSSYIDPNGSSNKNKNNKSPLFNDPSDYKTGKKNKSNSKNKTNNNSSNKSKKSNTSKTSTSLGNSFGINNPKSTLAVFIGDSRTVQMYAYLNDSWNGANYSSGGVHVVSSDVYIGEGSMGLKWMKNTGIPAAKPYFNNGSAIIILMGVNDLSNYDNYLSYINSNASTWKKNGSSLYFVSVNPCADNYSDLNDKIEEFNIEMKNGLSKEVGFIDTYSFLIKNGYKTVDGLHYDKSTYKIIYNYIKSQV